MLVVCGRERKWDLRLTKGTADADSSESEC